MKVLIAGLAASPDQPNAQALTAELSTSLKQLGHETDVFALPAVRGARAALRHSLAATLLDVGPDADRLVTLGWQCHFLAHPAKVAVVHSTDPLLRLLENSVEDPVDDRNRTAARNAFRRCRRIVAGDAPTRATLARVADPETVMLAEPLLSPESVERWLR